jgi:hypothetical protein
MTKKREDEERPNDPEDAEHLVGELTRVRAVWEKITNA